LQTVPAGGNQLDSLSLKWSFCLFEARGTGFVNDGRVVPFTLWKLFAPYAGAPYVGVNPFLGRSSYVW